MSTKVNHRSWLLVGSLFGILGGCHRTHGQSSVISVREYVPPPQVPNIIRVPDGQTVLLKALGKGVQIYGCTATAPDPGKFGRGPQARADLPRILFVQSLRRRVKHPLTPGSGFGLSSPKINNATKKVGVRLSTGGQLGPARRSSFQLSI